MSLDGTTWIVTQLDPGGDQLAPVIEGTALTFEFDGERVHGSAGCNRYFGPATIGETVQIGPLATTMMYCSHPEGVMEQERRFLDVLSGADSVRIEDDLLEFSSTGKVRIVMVPALGESE
jgi:heat shock protein HslJ